jgi:hypothetical protein
LDKRQALIWRMNRATLTPFTGELIEANGFKKFLSGLQRDAQETGMREKSGVE